MDAEQGTIAVRPGEELDAERLAAFLRERIAGLPAGPLSVRQFPSGASNLTYLIRIGDWSAVLRRPPLGPLPPKAHDMVREARLLERLAPVYPRAPRPLAIADDPAILGVPFYVMERRAGIVLDTDLPRYAPPGAGAISEALIVALAELHAVDWRGVGLGDLGYPEGFLTRQVRGWIGRYEAARTDDDPRVAPLVAWLAANLPPEQVPTLIHNDFKLNNLLLDPDDLGRIVGVVDWEMATIGDPLFDLAIALSYWVEPGDPPALRAILPVVTDRPGFLDRAALAARYAARSGRDLGALDFYLTLAYFKLAVILQQIYARWHRGQTRDERFRAFGAHVRVLIAHAADRAGV